MARLDITGQRFGRLLAICRLPDPNRHGRWLCKCDCGREKTILIGDLRRSRGREKSCGCGPVGNTKHGGRQTRLYRIWTAMIRRCSNPKCDAYSRYGGRGIVITDQWRDFGAFRTWASAHGYGETLTIDRINNDGNYEPGNCRWVSHRQQCLNRSTNRLIVHNGERLALIEWAERLGMKPACLIQRLTRGWTVERAMTAPIRHPRSTVRERC